VYIPCLRAMCDFTIGYHVAWKTNVDLTRLLKSRTGQKSFWIDKRITTLKQESERKQAVRDVGISFHASLAHIYIYIKG
jgi:hypothetical protein